MESLVQSDRKKRKRKKSFECVIEHWINYQNLIKIISILQEMFLLKTKFFNDIYNFAASSYSWILDESSQRVHNNMQVKP